jgi:predicted MFS family arabinose efflux permease
MQVPTGILADTVGPRRLMAAGSLVASVGSLVFALAPSWLVAAVGRTLVGTGASVAFIAVLKLVAVWFPPDRFATLVGVTMFAGNVGAVLAGAPLAWVIGGVSWRTVFVALSVLSLVVAVASWVVVRDRPEPAGDRPGSRERAGGAATVEWTVALRDVAAKPPTWLGFLVTLGVGGSFLAFAGLWAAPYLMEVHGTSRVVAAQHVSLLLLGVAVGSVVIGVLSDRLGSRSGLMQAYAALYALSWVPWVLRVRWPVPATLAWFLLMGLLVPAFTLAMSLSKEANRPEHSGIATSVVNVGVFLGASVLQPLIGWHLDHGRATGDVAGAWSHGIRLLAGAAVLGLAASLGFRARVRLPWNRR